MLLTFNRYWRGHFDYVTGFAAAEKKVEKQLAAKELSNVVPKRTLNVADSQERRRHEALIASEKRMALLTLQYREQLQVRGSTLLQSIQFSSETGVIPGSAHILLSYYICLHHTIYCKI